jgi:hypothetical protein
LLVAEGEEADDVRVAEPEQRVELLPEHAVEPLAAAVNLDGGERAGEAREVHGAEPALADHGRGEPACHRVHLRQRKPPRLGLGPLVYLLPERIAAGAVHVVVAFQFAGAAAAEEELVPLYPHLLQESFSLPPLCLRSLDFLHTQERRRDAGGGGLVRACLGCCASSLSPLSALCVLLGEGFIYMLV